VQINLQVQWHEKRINILDVLKPTEEEITKYYSRKSSDIDSNDDSLNDSPDNKSTDKFIFKSEPSMSNVIEYDREEAGNSMKRNQKPSESILKFLLRCPWQFVFGSSSHAHRI
jgi:GA-binding protein alpha chain